MGTRKEAIWELRRAGAGFWALFRRDVRRCALLDELEQLGFYRGMSEEDVSSSKDLILLARSLLADEWHPRICDMDAENIYESGAAEEFLNPLAARLRQLGLPAFAFADRRHGGRHLVCSGEAEILLYDEAEVICQSHGWLLATRRTLELVNAHLVAHGFSDRFYVDYGTGSDALALLLSPEMYDAIRRHGLPETRELVPVEELEWTSD